MGPEQDRKPFRDSIHLTVEAFRRAMFDRAELLGDPDFNKIPVAQLTDKRYAQAWRETVDLARATPSQKLQRPASKFIEMDLNAAARGAALHESPNTTHVSVVDEAGNAVAMT